MNPQNSFGSSQPVEHGSQSKINIRAVLNDDWDPIGVADIVDDEYDMYIANTYSLLATDSTEHTIAGHLLRIELERMGSRERP